MAEQREYPQEGKWRLIYNVAEDHYNYSDASSKAGTPSTNEVEYLDSKQDCIDKVVELGITLKVEEED